MATETNPCLCTEKLDLKVIDVLLVILLLTFCFLMYENMISLRIVKPE